MGPALLPVNYEISLGPPEPSICVVPDVTGQKLTIAEEAVRAAGCLTRTVTVSSETVPEGNVISTSPGPNTKGPLGTLVFLTVSGGVPENNGNPCIMPNVVGLGAVNAERGIDRTDCTVGAVTYMRTSTVPADHVISTSPPAGTQKRALYPVSLLVSLGTQPPPTEPCQVPALKGVGVSQAVRDLEFHNCLPGTITLEFSQTIEAGKIINTVPPVGTVIRTDLPVVDIIESMGRRGDQ